MATGHPAGRERRRWLKQGGAWLVAVTGVVALAPSRAAAPPAADMTEGEVRKIDKAAAKITLKHGEIRNLSMPAMTMPFAVQDKAMLERVKVGDKVRFRAVDESGQLRLTALEIVR